MTKEEALRKIEELRKFVEEQEKEFTFTVGQIYRHKSTGDLYMVRYEQHFSGREFDFVALNNGIGKYWGRDGLRDVSEDSFEYVGMFDDVFTLR